MNNTEIKTRHGLILQTLTARALELAGYDFAENHQYDEICEVPDFLIPDGNNPKFMIEVHQTEARNSFQMKTLRAFTAVIESKAHYSDELICVNVLFGDPANEVPESNLKALCGFFDLNIISRYDANDRAILEELETVSLRLASTENLSVKDGADQAAEDCPGGVAELSRMIEKLMEGSTANAELKKIWQSERTRMRQLGPAPGPGERSYHKRNILRSLFFTDSQFEELVTKEDPSDYSRGLSNQLVRCKLAEWEEQIWGDELVIENNFREFIKKPATLRLRQLCQSRLDRNDEMKFFFADIREESRRIDMCCNYITLRDDDFGNIASLMSENLHSDSFEGINHRRCWIADLLARELGVSHNRLNRELVQQGFDPEKLGNPYNQISYKSSRFMGKKETHSIYCVGAQKAAQKIATEGDADLERDPSVLAQRFLELRLDGVIKLQKLNPLYLAMESVCELCALTYSQVKTQSIISDLSGAARSTGKYDLYHITDGKKTIILNAVAVHDGHGDDKSKEWGARRRAVGYRLKDDKVQIANFDEAVFVIDGDWETKHVERLHRAGWTRIIRIDQVEGTFREIFSIPSEADIHIPEEPLPLAAESEEDIPKLSQ